MAFRGHYEHSLDSKDRITVPARFRAELAGGAVLSAGLDPCIEVYPVAEYTKFEEHVLGELKDTIACDISRARAELGYDPQTSLLDGMRASVRDCLEHGEIL